jgi:hypothetical protein
MRRFVSPFSLRHWENNRAAAGWWTPPSLRTAGRLVKELMHQMRRKNAQALLCNPAKKSAHFHSDNVHLIGDC